MILGVGVFTILYTMAAETVRLSIETLTRSTTNRGVRALRRQGTDLTRRVLHRALVALGMCALSSTRADTVALWLFDEPAGVYPSSVLNDAGPDSHFLILGRGAEIAPGKFGRALRPISPRPLAITARSAGAVRFGLQAPPTIPGRTQPPLLWENAHFAALTTRGDAHLRRAPFANITDSRLNLGAGDWTVEGWFLLDAGAREEGVILELGAGPRGENELLTRLSVLPRENAFAITGLAPDSGAAGAPVARRVEFPNPEGPPGGAAVLCTATLASPQPLPRDRWFHAALVHTAEGELRLFVDGQRRASIAADFLALPRGDESYLSVGRDGRWQRAFPGAIDELRVSDHAVYTRDGAAPQSFSRMQGQARSRPAGSGFSVDDCVHINGNEIDDEVEWLAPSGQPTKDLSALAGRSVQLVVRMRGTSLHALQFSAR